MTRFGLPMLLLVLAAAGARADDPIDTLLDSSPTFPTPKIVRTYSNKLAPLWIEALDRPETELRCQTALTIAKAHRSGMSGLSVTVPALTRELSRPDQHRSVPLACAGALIALEAKDAAPALFKLTMAGDGDLRELIEPALARWNYSPAREEWLKRLNLPAPRGRSVVLAMQSLTVAREEKAAPRLRELVLSAETPPILRLEGAMALGSLKTSGSELDADHLSADATPRGLIGRLAAAWILRQHKGGEAIRRLQAFVKDPEPSVAAVAIARLVEIDPAHVELVLAPALASPDANVRAFGVEVLFRRPSDDHIRLLGDRLSDAHPDVRSQARRALRELATKFRNTVIREADRAMVGKDWRGREQSAILFAHLDHKPAAGRLADALSDDRPEAAIAAAWALRVLAVPETYARVLAHIKRYAVKDVVPPEWRDCQLAHLVQLMGLGRYEPADATLRSMIPPKAPAGLETRASACWALGLLHEGKATPAVAGALAGRLSAVNPGDVEDERVRRVCAVSLGRMKAEAQLPALRRFYTDKKPTFGTVNNACAWAIEQVTGEKMPPAGTFDFPQRNWFLIPLG